MEPRWYLRVMSLLLSVKMYETQDAPTSQDIQDCAIGKGSIYCFKLQRSEESRQGPLATRIPIKQVCLHVMSPLLPFKMYEGQDTNLTQDRPFGTASGTLFGKGPTWRSRGKSVGMSPSSTIIGEPRSQERGTVPAGPSMQQTYLHG